MPDKKQNPLRTAESHGNSSAALENAVLTNTNSRTSMKYSRPSKALEKSFLSVVLAWEGKDYDNSLSFDSPGYEKRKIWTQEDHSMAMRFSVRRQIVTGMIDTIAAEKSSDRIEVATALDRDRGNTSVRDYWTHWKKNRQTNVEK